MIFSYFFLFFSFPRTNVLLPVQHLSPYSVGHYSLYLSAFPSFGMFFFDTRGMERIESISKVSKAWGFWLAVDKAQRVLQRARHRRGHGIFPGCCCPFSILRNLFKEVINSILTGGFEHFLSSPR